MKKAVLYLSFMLVIFNLSAQDFPLDGSTWYFDASNPYSMDEMLQKWEYIEDSITSDEMYKVIKVTIKIVNPLWIPTDTVIEQIGYRYFFYDEEQIWRLDNTLSPLADFSLQVGDSTYTPYHSTQSPFFPLIFESNCSEEVQDVFFQKGVVTETGIDTEDGIDSRYYILKFKNELGEWILRKFSERSIITEGFWHYNNEYLADCSISDGISLFFLCHKDDFSTNLVCDDEYRRFETLDIEKEKILVKVYPNPFSESFALEGVKEFEDLKIYNPLGKEIHYEIVENRISPFTNESGIYFLSFSKNGEWHNFKMIKQ